MNTVITTVDVNDGNVLVGTITRKVICTLIKHRGQYTAYLYRKLFSFHFNLWMYECTIERPLSYASIFKCMFICMYVCMYVCMHYWKT